VRRDEFEGIDIRRELRQARPEPTREFASTLANRVQAEAPRRRVAPRMALAIAMTIVGLAVAAAFGGISQAASSVEGAVTSIVHVGHKAKAKPKRAQTHKASGTKASAATTGAANGSQAQAGGSSHGGGYQPPPAVQPPTSPSSDQYTTGCTQFNFRGPYIACHAP
jgi:uncharacterized membrane protein YgcG